LQREIDTLNVDFAKLQQAARADPGYRGATPMQQQVNAAIADVQQSINAGTASGNKSLSQAKSVADAAEAEAAAFVKQYCG
jgi:hypothetical protein